MAGKASYAIMFSRNHHKYILSRQRIFVFWRCCFLFRKPYLCPLLNFYTYLVNQHINSQDNLDTSFYENFGIKIIPICVFHIIIFNAHAQLNKNITKLSVTMWFVDYKNCLQSIPRLWKNLENRLVRNFDCLQIDILLKFSHKINICFRKK